MIWLELQTVAQISAERILNALPEGLLIVIFAWVLLRALRKQNSGTRFAVWFLALLTLAVLPLLSGFGEFHSADVNGNGSTWGSMRPAITIPGHWALFVFLAWVAGACAGMTRLAVGLWRLQRLRQSCAPISVEGLDPTIRKTLDAIAASISSGSRSFGSNAITIATSETLRVPAAIGFWCRTIVLPRWTLRELPPADLSVILIHEFEHLRRGDDWTNLVQKIVRALLFFHPAVWWIENRLSVEREMACDDAVLAATANPLGYANCLVSLLEKSLAHRGFSMAQAAVNRARETSLRLAQILDKDRPVATRVWTPALAMAGAFSLVCLIALPHAPQVVAFDRGIVVTNSDHAYSAAVDHRAGLQTAAVIAATLRTGESSTNAATKTPIAKVLRAHSVAGQKSLPQRLTVALNAPPAAPSIVEVSASADREVAPEFQTLVLIEATQFITSDSSVWRVQVWRVTLVGTSPERLGIVPVAHSI